MLFQRWEKELVEGTPWDMPVNRIDWSSYWCDCWEAANQTRNVSYKSKIFKVNRVDIAPSQNL